MDWGEERVRRRRRKVRVGEGEIAIGSKTVQQLGMKCVVLILGEFYRGR